MDFGGFKPPPQDAFYDERDPKFNSDFGDRDFRGDERGFRGPPKREWGDRDFGRYPNDKPPYRDSRIDNRDFGGPKRRRWRDDAPESPPFHQKEFKEKRPYGGGSRFSNFSDRPVGYRDRGSGPSRDDFRPSGGPPPSSASSAGPPPPRYSGREPPRMYNRDPYDYRDSYRNDGGGYDRGGYDYDRGGYYRDYPGESRPRDSDAYDRPPRDSDYDRSRDSADSGFDRASAAGAADDDRREPGERTPEGRPSSSSSSRYREPGETSSREMRDPRRDDRGGRDRGASSDQMYSPNSPSRDSPVKGPESPPPSSLKRPRLGWGQGLMGTAPKEEPAQAPAPAPAPAASSATTEQTEAPPAVAAPVVDPTPLALSLVSATDAPLTPSTPLSASNALSRSLVSSTGSTSALLGAPPSSVPPVQPPVPPTAAASRFSDYQPPMYQHQYPAHHPYSRGDYGGGYQYHAPPPAHQTRFDVLPQHLAQPPHVHTSHQHSYSITADLHRKQHHELPPPTAVIAQAPLLPTPPAPLTAPSAPSVPSALAVTPSTAELPLPPPDAAPPKEKETAVPVESKPAEVPKEKEAEPEPEPPKKDLPKREDVLTNIEKLDAEIAQLEHEIINLKNALNRPKHAVHVLHKHLHGSIIQQIYDDNKEKSAAAADSMAALVLPPKAADGSAGAMPSLPLPKNLLELPMCQENARRHAEVRARLAQTLQVQRAETRAIDQKLARRYRKKFDTWRRKLLSDKRRKLAQLRAAEPQPPAGKARKEQLTRSPGPGLGSPSRNLPLRGSTGNRTPGGSERRRGLFSDAVRSEEEFAAVCAALADEESQDPNRRYLRTIAVVPAMIVHPRDKGVRFYNTNGCIEDMRELELRRKNDNPWSEQEKAVFLEKYMAFPKRFKKISEFLPNKSCQDVVAYYFLNKRKLNLKKIMNSSRGRRGSGPTPARPKMAAGVPRELANLGITSDFWQATPMSFMLYGRDRGTRGRVRTSTSTPISPSASSLEVDDLAASGGSSHAAAADSSSDSSDNDLPQAPVAPPTERPPAKPRGRPPLNRSVPAQPPPSSSSPPHSPIRPKPQLPAARLQKASAAGAESAGSPDDDQPTRWTDAERDLFYEALAKYAKDFKAVAEHVGSKNQFQCKNYYHNYRKRFNLDEIIEGGYRPRPSAGRPSTPAGGASTSAIAPSSSGSVVAAAASSSSVSRAKAPAPEDSSSSSPEESDGEGQLRVVSYWTAGEKEDFLKYFRQYGRNWKVLSQHITTKSQNQIKNYFQNYKVKLNLNLLLEQRERDRGRDPPQPNKRGPKPKKPTGATAPPGASEVKPPGRRGRPPKRKLATDEEARSESSGSSAESRDASDSEVVIDDSSAHGGSVIDEGSNLSATLSAAAASAQPVGEDSLHSAPPSPLLHSDTIRPYQHFAEVSLPPPAVSVTTATTTTTVTTTTTITLPPTPAPATASSSAQDTKPTEQPMQEEPKPVVATVSVVEAVKTETEITHETEPTAEAAPFVTAPLHAQQGSTSESPVPAPAADASESSSASVSVPVPLVSTMELSAASDSNHATEPQQLPDAPMGTTEQQAEAASPAAPSAADDSVPVSAAEPLTSSSPVADETLTAVADTQLTADPMQTESTPAPASPHAADLVVAAPSYESERNMTAAEPTEDAGSSPPQPNNEPNQG